MYTEGSSETVLPVAYIEGYVVHVLGCLVLGAPMPKHLLQTINTTGLYAVLQACLDTEYYEGREYYEAAV